MRGLDRVTDRHRDRQHGRLRSGVGAQPVSRRRARATERRLLRVAVRHSPVRGIRRTVAGWQLTVLRRALRVGRGHVVRRHRRRRRTASLRPRAAIAGTLLAEIALAGLAGTWLAGTELAGTELAGTELAGTGLAGTGLVRTKRARPRLAEGRSARLLAVTRLRQSGRQWQARS